MMQRKAAVSCKNEAEVRGCGNGEAIKCAQISVFAKSVTSCRMFEIDKIFEKLFKATALVFFLGCNTQLREENSFFMN